MTKHTSIYPTKEIASKIMAMYEEKLSKWPVMVETIDVPTRYGLTRIVAAR